MGVLPLGEMAMVDGRTGVRSLSMEHEGDTLAVELARAVAQAIECAALEIHHANVMATAEGG